MVEFLWIAANELPLRDEQAPFLMSLPAKRWMSSAAELCHVGRSSGG